MVRDGNILHDEEGEIADTDSSMILLPRLIV